MVGYPTPDRHAAGQLLATTATQLRARRDDLEPLVAEYDRVQRISGTFGDLPAGDTASSLGEYGRLVGRLRAIDRELQEWLGRLEPLVREYEQILHVLQAVEAAEALPANAAGGRRRSRAGRGAPRSGVGHARTEELRGLLTEPRARTEIAEMMGLSRARVTELLEPLARAGEVVEIRDPDRPTRKLWSLVPDAAGGDEDTDAAPADAGPAGSDPATAGPPAAGPGDGAPADSAPADDRPAGPGPADAAPAGSGPEDARPADAGAADSGPADAAPGTSPAAEDRLAG